MIHKLNPKCDFSELPAFFEICNAYSIWLQLPNPIPPEEMTDEQIRQLAIMLYKEKR